MKKSLIGIEISTSEVVMAQFTPSGLLTAVERLPENLVRDDRIISHELLSSFLKEMRSSHGFSGKKCVLLLPETSTYFRAISLPVMSENQLKLNLPYEFRDFVGNDSMRYFYDYALENMETDEAGSPVSMDILAAAASRQVVDEYRHLLRNGGLRLAIALPREMALIYLFRKHSAVSADPYREFCLIDVGYDHTRIYISAGEKLRASKIVDIGCRQIDEAIASVYNIDKYLAASYRYTNHENVLDFPECRSVYERIALEIMKTVNFYKYENQQTEICDVYFCGLGASLEGLCKEIIGYIDFEQRDILEILPEECAGVEAVPRCLMALSATLGEEE